MAKAALFNLIATYQFLVEAGSSFYPAKLGDLNKKKWQGVLGFLDLPGITAELID